MKDFLARLDEAERNFVKSQGMSFNQLEKLQAARRRYTNSLPTTWYQIAAYIVAPVFVAFATWMADQKTEKSLYLGVMREGHLLAQLMRDLFEIPADEIWLNRNLTMLAAYGYGDRDSLMNWLVHTRLQPITKSEAFYLLTNADYDGTDGQQILNTENVRAFINRLGTTDARQRKAALADRLVEHWQKICGDKSTVMLMDFASAGNIQRSLQTILRARNITANITGLNFAMTKGSRWAEHQGCVMQGFLSERGDPAWFASAYARTPELIEIFAASPMGSLQDYKEQGQPVCGKSFLTPAQHDQVNDAQKLILNAAAFYQRALGKDLNADLVRCLWGRFLLQPLKDEVEVLGFWPLDSGLDGSAQRVLAARPTTSEPWSKMQSAWPAGSRAFQG